MLRASFTIAIVWRSAAPLIESAKAWSLPMFHSVRPGRTPLLIDHGVPCSQLKVGHERTDAAIA